MLTIYAPSNNPKSKCWEVFNGIRKTWPTSNQILDNAKETKPKSPAFFWGFVNHNLDMIKECEKHEQEYWFADTPYFGRFDNTNLKPNNHYWRICKNRIHAKFIKNCSADRFEKFNLKIKDIRKTGDYILVCPSSPMVNKYLGQDGWLDDTINELKKHTDRPIKIREKPRGRGTSGPSEAKVPIEEELKNAWACVTSVSICAVDAALAGVPVFSHEKSSAKLIASTNLSEIELPPYTYPDTWLYSLAYQQFTPEEIENGVATGIFFAREWKKKLGRFRYLL